MMRPFERLATIWIKEDQPEDFKGLGGFGKDAAHPYIRQLYDRLQERKTHFKQTEKNGEISLDRVIQFVL